MQIVNRRVATNLSVVVPVRICEHCLARRFANARLKQTEWFETKQSWLRGQAVVREFATFLKNARFPAAARYSACALINQKSV